MKTAKSLSCLFGVLFVPSQIAFGQSRLELEFRDEKRFQIVGPEEFEYLGGQWSVTVVDGEFPLLPCAFNDGLEFVNPNLFCPNGTTTLLTQGDLDGDGLQDIGRYYSTDPPIPAGSIEPFAAGLVEVFAIPANSDLPIPLDGQPWADFSVRGFYDLVSDSSNAVGFDKAEYLYERGYLATEISRHREEIVPGTYQFRLPALGSTVGRPLTRVLSVTHVPMVEAFPGPGSSGNVNVGTDFILLEDERWNNGVVEIDPRTDFKFEWQGFNQATFLFDDLLTFAIRSRDTGLVRFPPVPSPGDPNPDTRQLIGSSDLGIPTGIDIGPNFFEPDEALVAELEFRRAKAEGSSVDRSARFFRWNIDLIDTYPGFRNVSYPLGSSSVLTAPASDFDGDGFTNLEEFGLQTDPTDPASVPNTTPVLDPFTQQCVLEVPKRPAIGDSLSYRIQYSADLETWVTIDRDDPNFVILFDDEDRIVVLSRRPAGVFPCFVRVRFEQN